MSSSLIFFIMLGIVLIVSILLGSIAQYGELQRKISDPRASLSEENWRISPRSKQIIVAIIVLIMAIFAVYSQVYFVRAFDLLKSDGVQGTATITRFYVVSDKNQTDYSVQYVFKIENTEKLTQQYKGSGSVSESLYKSLSVGKNIDILYSRSHPEINCPQSKCDLLEPNYFFGVVASILCIISFVNFFKAFKRP